MGVSANITLRMKFFAAARDMTNVSEESLSVPSSYDTADLLQHLQKRYPKLATLQEQLPTILAVNQSFLPVGETVKLQENDEVALIPPISGG